MGPRGQRAVGMTMVVSALISGCGENQAPSSPLDVGAVVDSGGQESSAQGDGREQEASADHDSGAQDSSVESDSSQEADSSQAPDSNTQESPIGIEAGPPTLLTRLPPFYEFQVREGMVWISDKEKGGITRYSRANGSSTVIVPGEVATHLAVDEVGIYWINGEFTSNASFVTAAHDGSSRTVLVEGLTLWGGGGMTARGGSVYWFKGSDVYGSPGMIMKTDAVTRVTTPLAEFTGSLTQMVADDHAFVWFGYPSPQTGGVFKMLQDNSFTVLNITTAVMVGEVAIADGRAFWTDWNGGTIMTEGVQGLLPKPIITGANSPTYIAADSRRVYWTESAKIRMASWDGASVSTLVDGTAGGRLALDGTDLYFADVAQNGLCVVALDE